MKYLLRSTHFLSELMKYYIYFGIAVTNDKRRPVQEVEPQEHSESLETQPAEKVEGNHEYLYTVDSFGREY